VAAETTAAAGAAAAAPAARPGAAGKPPKAGGKRTGPRPKHVPQRMCVACRGHDAKRGLHRLVRTPEGPVVADPTGKRNGRGAYLCDNPACWDKALAGGILARALKLETEIDDETVAALRQFASTLAPEKPAADGAADGTKE